MDIVSDNDRLHIESFHALKRQIFFITSSIGKWMPTQHINVLLFSILTPAKRTNDKRHLL
jgi:hypothetical protein